MNHRGITAGLLAAGIVMAGLIVWLFAGQDHTPPEIIVENAPVSYRDSMKESELLEGIRAVDDRDKDVSDQVFVGEISKIGEKDYVFVTYIAIDHSNNVAQKTIRMEYEK